MRKLISSLSRSALARRAVLALHLDRVANAYLARFPMRKRMPASGVHYRAARLESIPLSVEMLERQVTYDTAFLKTLGPINTFADLGCNVGYFTVLLAHLSHPRSIQGLMIDANADAVEEASWHVHANQQLAGVVPVWGMVGCSREAREADFFLYASNICSSREPLGRVHPELKGSWTRVKTPCLHVNELWKQRFGTLGCDLLKIDVEGAELDFLKAEPDFIARVSSILLEWHKWSVQLKQIEEFLTRHGFALDRIFEEDNALGTCVFRRRSAP